MIKYFHELPTETLTKIFRSLPGADIIKLYTVKWDVGL